MAKILGLDLGTNSIGWTLTDEKNNIIKTGVRIFPEGVNKDNSGTETSKNTSRRIARGTRRQNYRFKIRRKKLKKILTQLEMMPDDKYYSYKKGEKKNLTIELYKLRKEALEKNIDLKELGRIFLQLNNHRGFKSNKKEEASMEFDERQQQKKEETGKVKSSIGKLREEINKAKEEKKIKHGTLGEYFYFLIEQNKDSHNPNEPISKIRNNEKGEGFYTHRDMFEEEFDLIWNEQKKYYPKILTDANKKIIRDECIFYQRDLRSQKHLINRCIYEFTEYFDKKQNKKIRSYLRCCPKSALEFQEFRIWEQVNKIRYNDENDSEKSFTLKQKQLLVAKLHNTKELIIESHNKSSKEEKEAVIKLKKELGLSEEIKFKDPKKLKGNITLVKLIEALGKDFRNKYSLQQSETTEEYVNESTGELFPLTTPIHYSEIQKLLYDNVFFSMNFSKSEEWLKGNFDAKNANYKRGKKKGQPTIKWKERLKQIGLSSEQIEEYARITFEPDYTAYSLKAIKKLLPWMKTGMDVTDAAKMVGYESASDIRKNDNQLTETLPALKNNELRNPIVQQATSDAIRLVNEIIQKELNGEKPDKVRIEMAREMKKPKKVREEMTRKMREKEDEKKSYAEFLSKKYNKQINADDSIIIKFELFLELSFSKEYFEKHKEEINIDDFKTFQKEVKPTAKDEEKYQLWLECDRTLPYTGEPISLSELLSSEIEIEHIIPYSRCMDNSFVNKTLSDKAFNAKKGNRTPVEYFESVGGKEKKNFEQRVKKFSEGKRERFQMPTDKIDGFKKSQINNTAYIARQVASHLRNTFKADDIEITNGQTTALIRRLLGLNSILNPDGYKKSREDHRHHAIDAFVTAIANRKIINAIEQSTEGYYTKDGNWIKKFDEYGQLTKEAIKEIKNKLKTELQVDDLFVFRNRIQPHIEKILISHRSDSRITSSSKKQLYKHGKPVTNNGKQIYSGGDVARGELHKQYYYGNIMYPHKDNPDWIRKNKEGGIYAIRKVLKYDAKGYFNNEKQLELIIDRVVREQVLERVKAVGIKKAFSDLDKNPIYMKTKPGKEHIKVPIKSVRIVSDANQLLPLRAHEQEKKDYKKVFVQAGDNFQLAIYYTDAKPKKREFHLISFFEAAQAKKKSAKENDNGKNLYPDEKNEKPIKKIITKGKCVLLYEKHREEINWNDNTDLFKRLYVVKGLSSMLIKQKSKNKINEYPYAVMTLKKHNEARKDTILNLEKGEFKLENPKPLFQLYHTQFNGLIEGIHFSISPTGTITEIK